MTKKDFRFFKYAEQISHLSDFRRVKIGCIAVYRGQIISIGFNSTRTHTVQGKYAKQTNQFDTSKYRPCIHAEIACLLKIRYRDINFREVKLYVFRRDRNGNLAPSRPCEACQAALRDKGIFKIYYTTKGGYAEEILS